MAIVYIFSNCGPSSGFPLIISNHNWKRFDMPIVMKLDSRMDFHFYLANDSTELDAKVKKRSPIFEFALTQSCVGLFFQIEI